MVQEHYTVGDFKARVSQRLKEAGLDGDHVDWAHLKQLDQFHVRGLAASEELAKALDIKSEDKVLDVGSGLGGPARFLAATYGCQVTGIDLTAQFVEVSNMLAEKTGLADKLHFDVGDAVHLPYPDGSFDIAWTQHVAMNIHDRDGLYASVFRVLKPGGSFAIYDVVATSDEPLTYPVPWASDPSISFLLTADQMRDSLHRAGFADASWADTTEQAIAWFGQLLASQGNSPLGLGVIMGPDFPLMAKNLMTNLQEGRARLCQAIVRKP